MTIIIAKVLMVFVACWLSVALGSLLAKNAITTRGVRFSLAAIAALAITAAFL